MEGRTEIDGTDEQSINAFYRSNLIDSVECFFGLNLHYRQEGVVRLLEVLCRRDTKTRRRVRRSEPSPAPWWELCSLYECPCFVRAS